jgi:TonB family protein
MTERFRLSLPVSIIAVIGVGLGLMGLTRARGQDSQPAQNAGHAPRKDREIVCDHLTFANCHEVNGVTLPTLVHSVDSDYPREASRLGLQGTCTLKLVVDEKGKPRNITVVHSLADKLPAEQREAGLKMDENAIKALKKWRFKPALLNNQPVPIVLTFDQYFHIYP